MVENHDGFFQEIEEDVKLEKLEKLWKEYQNHIIAGVVAFALMVAGGIYWNHHRHEKRNQIAQVYADALSHLAGGQKEKGFEMLDTIKDEKGYGPMAMMAKATELAKDPQTLPQALEIFTQVVENRSYDKKFSMLAALMRSLYELDAGDSEQAREHLEILQDPNNPWQALALELEAALEHKAGNTEKARELYKQLAEDARASQTMRARALAVLTDLK